MDPIDKRPVFLNLTQIHMPVMAVLSIAHRITGVLLFLCIPFSVYLLDLSLSSKQGYQEAADLLHNDLVRMLLVLLLWIFAHHFFAGIRYLLIDMDIGVDLKSGRSGAWLVIGSGIVAMLIGGLTLL